MARRERGGVKKGRVLGVLLLFGLVTAGFGMPIPEPPKLPPPDRWVQQLHRQVEGWEPPPIPTPIKLPPPSPVDKIGSLPVPAQLKLCREQGICPSFSDTPGLSRYLPRWEEACRRGSGESQRRGCWLAARYWEEHRHPQLGERLYLKSCQLGDRWGCRDYGFRLENSYRWPPSRERLQLARDFYWRSCQLGNGWGCLSLADSYQYPEDQTTDRFQLWLEIRGCQLGVGAGCADVGGRYLSEGRVEEGLRFLFRGCQLDRQRCVELGDQLLKMGRQEGVNLLLPLCRGKWPVACCDLGEYWIKQGGQQEGLNYYRIGCQKGFRECCRRLHQQQRGFNFQLKLPGIIE